MGREGWVRGGRVGYGEGGLGVGREGWVWGGRVGCGEGGLDVGRGWMWGGRVGCGGELITHTMKQEWRYTC